MTYITFLIWFIKSLLFLTLIYVPSLIIKVIIALLIISWFCYKTRRQVITKIIYINKYRIVNPIRNIIFVISITVGIISTLFSFKILNIGKSIDLYNLYLYIGDIFQISYIEIFVNSLLIIAFLLLGFMIYKALKNFIFEEFMSIHIYLSQFDYYWYSYHDYHESNDYNKIRFFFTDRADYLTEKIARYFCYDHIKDKYIEDKKYRFIRKYGLKTEKNLALIIVAIVIIYDCIFNNFILTKIYYVFPFTYLYILWRLIIHFYLKRYADSDKTLSIMLYYKRIGVSRDRKKNIIAVYEDGVELDEETLLEAHDYVINGFRYKPNDQRIKARKEMVEAYLNFVKNTKQHKDGYLVFKDQEKTDNNETNK